jgi:hypothetical protein
MVDISVKACYAEAQVFNLARRSSQLFALWKFATMRIAGCYIIAMALKANWSFEH